MPFMPGVWHQAVLVPSMEYIFSGHEQLICLAEDSSTLAKGITSGSREKVRKMRRKHRLAAAQGSIKDQAPGERSEVEIHQNPSKSMEIKSTTFNEKPTESHGTPSKTLYFGLRSNPRIGSIFPFKAG